LKGIFTCNLFNDLNLLKVPSSSGGIINYPIMIQNFPCCSKQTPLEKLTVKGEGIMSRFRIFLSFIIVLLSLFVTLNCGGGSSGSDPTPPPTVTPSVLNGTYLASMYDPHWDGPSIINEATLYQIAFDGNGNFTMAVLKESHAGSRTDFTGTYSVSADREIAFTVDGVMVSGIVNSDGSVFTLALTGEPQDLDAGILVGIRKSSGLSNATLNGTYLASMFDPYWDGLDMINESTLYEFRFDGNGNFTADVLRESHSGSRTDFTGTYSVSADGEITTTATGLSYSGIVNSNGSVFTIALTGQPQDSDAGILIGIKKSSGLSNATLNGTYLASMYEPYWGNLYANSEGEATLYEITFDGNGNLTADVLKESVAGTRTDFTGAYSVSSEGEVTFTAGGLSHWGIVNLDGSVFTIALTGEPHDTDAGILVGIKKLGSNPVSSSTWYKDADGDGYSEGTTQTSATRPGNSYYNASELISISGDCNDNDDKTFPGSAEKESTTDCMTDADEDGYGSQTPAAGVLTGTDTYDDDPTTYPGANEICGDGKDNDQDGTIDEECDTNLSQSYYNPANGHWYQLNNNLMTYNEAKLFAESRNGYIATITSAAEGQWLYDTFGSELRIDTGWRFIAGNDDIIEDQWYWSTGEAWSYTNWYSGEPNNTDGDEDCIALHPYISAGHGHYWNDISCAASIHSLIEYDTLP
jgi:hypothetical protein